MVVSHKRGALMSKQWQQNLSRRERQIMGIIYERGEASAADVLENLPEPPSYSAVRAMLRILEEKGHLAHRKQGSRYVFFPQIARNKAAQSALKQLVTTFFDGSAEQAVAALLNVSDRELTPDELDRLADLIEKARKEGR